MSIGNCSNTDLDYPLYEVPKIIISISIVFTQLNQKSKSLLRLHFDK